jgi:hypothetical protein
MADNKEFEKMRAVTLNRVHRLERQKSYSSKNFIFDFINGLLKKPAFNIALAAGMFLIGFFINSNNPDDSFIQDIKLTAAESENIKSSYDSPFIFSNATFKENTDGSILVNFDVSRHIEIKGSKDDPLVREVLAQSLLNSETESQRLRNIDASKSIMHPKIKEALILTMLQDNNTVVRQKSLFSLIQYPNDTEIQNALLKVLKEEESVYMRLAAIDYLSNNKIDNTLLKQELGDSALKQNNAVYEKLKQLNYEGKTLK